MSHNRQPGKPLYAGKMRYWMMVLAALAVIPASADTRFRVRQMLRDDVPMGKGQCDIRLVVDNEVEVTVRGDTVLIRTLAGQEARDDGSECNFPLPERENPTFNFQVTGSRNETRLMEPPSRRNGFATVVRIRDSSGGTGRYQFRLTWEQGALSSDYGRGNEGRGPIGGRRDDEVRGPGNRGGRGYEDDRRGPSGFSWNNVVDFRGRGRGEAQLNGRSERLSDVTVDIDRGAKIVVNFRGERGRPVIFSGTLVGRDGARLRANMVSDDRRLRGTMELSVDGQQNVNSITMDATDGRDRLHLVWDRR